jgi:hypothetical protein
MVTMMARFHYTTPELGLLKYDRPHTLLDDGRGCKVRKAKESNP